MKVDVLVAGGGPAGCATALALAHRGVSVGLLERTSYEAPRLGEHLVPGARPLLEKLGLWAKVARHGHRRTPGTRSAWGQPEALGREHARSARGWGLDRARFDAALARGAEESGVQVLRGRCPRNIDGRPGAWAVEDSQGEVHEARWLVDATGRAAMVARRMGARREVVDRLVALAARIPMEHADAPLLVEATESGWWYTAPVPGPLAVVAFMTDADLVERPARAAWIRALEGAPLTSAQVGPEPDPGEVRVAAASSMRNLPCAGEGWVAVGDAASAFDPLSSQGISKALAGGLRAAEVIEAGLQGKPGPLVLYQSHVETEFERYLETRRHFYSLENRWPDGPFWERRT